MNIRMFSQRPTAGLFQNSLQGLLPDLYFYIHRMLGKTDHRILAQTCQLFYCFSLLPTMSDNPEQEQLAEHLYRYASTCPRADVAQYRFLQLHRFLETIKDPALVNYYRGIMLCHGQGIPINPEKGLDLLIASFKANNNHRTAYALGELIVRNAKSNGGDYIREEHFIHDRQDIKIKCSFWDVAVHPDEMKKIMATLEKMTQKGFAEANYILGFLYMLHRNDELAEKWFHLALRAEIPQAVHELFFMKCSPGKSLTKETKEIAAQYLRHLAIQYTSPIILREIYYQLSYWCLTGNEKSSALAESAKLNHSEALLELGYENEDKNPDLALNYFTKAFEFHHGTSSNAALTLYSVLAGIRKKDKLEREDMTAVNANEIKAVNYFKQKFTTHPNATADVVHCCTCTPSFFANNLKNVRLSPEQIWWYQMAQGDAHGNFYLFPNRLEKFAHDKVNPSAYAACAFGIQLTFGILHSATRFDAEKGQSYFDLAEKIRPGAIEEYLRAGISEGLMVPHIQELLEKQIQLKNNLSATIDSTHTLRR